MGRRGTAYGGWVRIVVVGAGMAGLSAAWELLAQGVPGAAITVLEASERPGGKLRQAEVAGHAVDVGAESMLARRPEAVDLLAEIGAADQLVTPATTAARLLSRGRLHPMPPGSLMGVPRRAADAAGILDAAEVARLAECRVPEVTEDTTVGAYVAAAVGEAVVDRLVEPLLGGVYAGDARRLSLAATVPQLYAKAVAGERLLSDVPPSEAPVAPPAGPVFAGIAGGVGRFPALLAHVLTARGVSVHAEITVRAIQPGSGSTWELTAGPTIAQRTWAADGLIVAVPPPAARRLLAGPAPAAAAILAGVELASMVIVTFAFESGSVAALEGSGFLVPPVERRGIKASTYSSRKWGWLAQVAPELTFVRASLGRYGEEAALQRPDADLSALAHRELAQIIGIALPPPVGVHVQRWGGALPQYAVGHLDRIALLHKHIDGVRGLEVAGAAYQGVGIPAVIASGRRAARLLAADLGLRD